MNKKLLIVSVALALVACFAVGITIAYLTDTTETVTNTFTVGKVEITLDEAPVDTNGTTTAGPRQTANSYKLIPGHTYDKDPTVHVDADSEPCILMVHIENELDDALVSTGTNSIESQLTANHWALVPGTTDYYYYYQVVGAGSDVTVFSKIQALDTLTDLTAFSNKTIKITAAAIQADGFATPAVAGTTVNDTIAGNAYSNRPSGF